MVKIKIRCWPLDWKSPGVESLLLHTLCIVHFGSCEDIYFSHLVGFLIIFLDIVSRHSIANYFFLFDLLIGVSLAFTHHIQLIRVVLLVA
jgi:hypothetical protein